jgi:hypothetical protein
MSQITEYLPPLLKGFGVVAVFVGIIETIVLIMVISLCCAVQTKNVNKSPQKLELADQAPQDQAPQMVEIISDPPRN